MPLTVSFQLSDNDLKFFTDRMNAARKKTSKEGETSVLKSANEMLTAVKGKAIPDFVKERFTKLETLTKMIADKSWNISGEDRTRIINAVAYVCDPTDLIPDNIPGIGLLDDAIMIELVCTDLQHDIDAYHDFCKYRDREVARRGAAGQDVAQATFLTARRTQLHERMRRRRATLWAARLGRSPF
jgi:uncharacterized membrane protein YkvA (DUF1232 family)